MKTPQRKAIVHSTGHPTGQSNHSRLQPTALCLHSSHFHIAKTMRVVHVVNLQGEAAILFLLSLRQWHDLYRCLGIRTPSDPFVVECIPAFIP
ncbi:uncharacterized [Tachysurus ichikawai]